jgi:hypothetical protein
MKKIPVYFKWLSRSKGERWRIWDMYKTQTAAENAKLFLNMKFRDAMTFRVGRKFK